MSVCEIKESWLLARQQGLGASEIAAVVGLSPWRQPIDVFVQKTQPLEMDEEIREALWFGTELEPVIRRRYEKVAQCDVFSGSQIIDSFPDRSIVRDGNTIVRDEQHPWLMGTPDGIVANRPKGVEFKNIGFKRDDWGQPGSDDVPDYYAIQCQIYMRITGYREWDLAPLFHGNKLENYPLKRNDELIKELVEAGRQFWNDHVLKGIPPPIDDSDSYARYLSRKYSLSSGVEIAPTPEIEMWAAKLREAHALRDIAESDAREAKNQLAELLGDATGCKTSLGKVGWVRPKVGESTDWKGLAQSLQPSPEQIKQFTSLKQTSGYVRAWFSKE